MRRFAPGGNEVSGEGYPKLKIRKLISFVLLLLILAVAAVIIVSLVLGYGFPPSWLSGMFSGRMPPISVNEFGFDIGRARTFTDLDGHIAAAGSLGIQVLDAGGTESLREPLRFSEPAITSYGNRCIAYDIGGTSVRVFDKTQILSSIETSNTIVSASLNHNGWFCVVTQGFGGFKGAVTVYNSSGDSVYGVQLATGYALSAQLSYDNKNLAILTLSETGSRITFYHNIDSEEEPAFAFDLIGGLIIDIVYLKNGNILAVSTESLIIIDDTGSSEELYEFYDKRLGGYTITNDFIALHLYDYGIGHQGRLITLLVNGTLLGEQILDREVISMSAFNNSLIILSDKVAFFNKELEEFEASIDNISAAGASKVLAVREDTALATSDNSAVVIRREEER